MVIAADGLITNRGFNTNAGFMPIYKVSGNTKVVIKSQIVETLTETGVGNAEKVLIGALPGSIRVRDTNNIANSTDTDKVVAGGTKGEISIWLMLTVIVADGRSTKNIWSV